MMKLIDFLDEDARTPAIVMVFAVFTSAYLLFDQYTIVRDAYAQGVYALGGYKSVTANIVEMAGCFIGAWKAKPLVDAAGGLMKALRDDWEAA